MHLMFVNYEFPPVGGGAAYASLATAREFVSMGHRVDFLTAQRERFAAAIRHLVRERFSWHSIARQYESIFEQSLKPRATKGSATERAEQPPVHGDRTRK